MSTNPSITVSGLVITEGQVTARATERRAGRRVLIRVAALEPESWESVVSALADDPSVMAALLDGELPAAVVEAAEVGGQTLEPSLPHLRWICGCTTWYRQCAHVKAVWREVETALQRQPAIVLTLRGRAPQRLAAEASALVAIAARDRDPGVNAASAYERSARGLPPLPDTPAPSAASPADFWLENLLPGQLLHDQAADAASRALDVLRGTGDGCLALDRESDLARIGAALPTDWNLDQLAWRAGMRPATLRRLVRAWRSGRRHGASEVVAPGRPVEIRPPIRPFAQEEKEEEAAPALLQLSLF